MIDEPIETRSDADLVATAAGIPVQAAYQLLERCGGVRGLARDTLAEQLPVLSAAVELGRRAVLAASLPAEVKLPDRTAVAAWAAPRLATLDHEELWVLSLDGNHGLRAATCVAKGGIHGLHVSARDCLRAALREAASAFVLVHNHPSGNPAPSDEDIAFTRAASAAASAVGVPLLDHVIVARRCSSSLLDLGLMGKQP